jgi:hypothetical protein
MDILNLSEKWKEQGDALFKFPAQIQTDTRLTETTRGFLTTVGLPKSAAPSVNFGISENRLLNVNQHYGMKSGKLDNFLVIGHNGSGDPICIDVASGDEITYLNHDNSFQQIWINSSAWQLSHSLLVYKIFYTSLINLVDVNDFSLRKFADTEFAELQKRVPTNRHSSIRPRYFLANRIRCPTLGEEQ